MLADCSSSSQDSLVSSLYCIIVLYTCFLNCLHCMQLHFVICKKKDITKFWYWYPFNKRIQVYVPLFPDPVSLPLTIMRKMIVQRLWIFLAGCLLLVTFCEVLIYWLVLLTCTWPRLNVAQEKSETLRAMLLADTHLLGTRNGHWLDKLRR